MSNSREKIAQHLYESGASEEYFHALRTQDRPILDPERALADAVIAAMPGLVKPLEWYDCPDNTSHDADCRYEISPHKYGFRLIKGVTGGGAYICDVSSRDIAKSAAQRHHVAQIMKAFGINDAIP